MFKYSLDKTNRKINSLIKNILHKKNNPVPESDTDLKDKLYNSIPDYSQKRNFGIPKKFKIKFIYGFVGVVFCVVLLSLLIPKLIPEKDPFKPTKIIYIADPFSGDKVLSIQTIQLTDEDCIH